MTFYIHHVPGRLRVCLAWLKRNANAAAALRAELASIQGIISIRTNVAIGSVTIIYDRDRVDPGLFLDRLRNFGEIGGVGIEAKPYRASAARRLPGAATDYVAKAAVQALLEWAIGRSAAALIGALI
jgi:hypothetical protein